MFRILSVLLMGVAVVAFSASKPTEAAEDVKLEGSITCAKCDLKLSKGCANVIVVEKDGKKTTYWFDAKSAKKEHGKVCQGAKDGTVTGTVSKDGDKDIVTVKEVKFK
jgi:hypothetical protein